MLEILLNELKDLKKYGKNTREYFNLFKDLITSYLARQPENFGNEEDVSLKIC